MGLFEKKICGVCGKKAGFLRTTLRDGTYVCADCAFELLMPEKKDNIFYYANFKLEDLNRFTLQKITEQRKANQDLVNKFTCTKSMGNCFHIDTANSTMVFTEKYNLRKNKINNENPPIFFFDSLCMYRVILVSAEEHASFTGSVVESEIYLLLGFNDAVYDFIAVPMGVMKIRQGLFKTKTDIPPMVEDALITCGQICQANNSASSDKELRKRLAYKAKDMGLLTADDILQELNDLI